MSKQIVPKGATHPYEHKQYQKHKNHLNRSYGLKVMNILG
jgi:hypothetical protein